MIDIDTFAEILNDLTEEIPDQIYKGLDGGVNIAEYTKSSPYARGNDLYILGEYVFDSRLGSRIMIYYGSFKHLFGHLDEGRLKIQLRKTLRHEFRHHIEHRAGLKDLEIEDRIFIEKYLSKYEDI